MPAIDPREYEQRLSRISAILGDIAAAAETSAASRCPYRDRHDVCTALFNCRNQIEDPRGAITCGHDGPFDYRDAWETHPRNKGRVMARLTDIHEAAERARRARGDEG